jgi:hypothetical protein
MDPMDRPDSDYRGWTLCVATDGRRKSLGHAVRRDRATATFRDKMGHWRAREAEWIARILGETIRAVLDRIRTLLPGIAP